MLDSLDHSFNDIESFLLNPSLDGSIFDEIKTENNNEIVSTQNHTDNSHIKSNNIQIYHNFPPIGIKNPKYKPIKDQGNTYCYENDPILYKKIKKKIQNRMSQQKKRSKTVCAIKELEEQVVRLENLNQSLVTQNKLLLKDNQFYQNKCLFYEHHFNNQMEYIEKPIN